MDEQYSTRVPKTSFITYPPDGVSLNFLVTGDVGCLHATGVHFDMGLK
jgi:hypothetical protein